MTTTGVSRGEWRLAKTENGNLTFRYYYPGMRWIEHPTKKGDEIAEYEATCRWDGCTDLHAFFNGDDSGNEESTDYIHICELPNFIAQLQALYEATCTAMKGTIGESEAWPGPEVPHASS